MAVIVPEGDGRAALRRAALAARRAMSPAAWQSANAALVAALAAWWQAWGARHRGTPWVGLYWPLKNEPDVRPVFADWPQRALPAAVAAHAPLEFRVWRKKAPMTVDIYGIPTPETNETVRPEVVIVPLVAFDRRGYRIGYGGGFYDRTLAAWRRQGWNGLAVGVGFDRAEVADVRPQSHDVPMDVVVTDGGVVLDASDVAPHWESPFRRGSR